ncbi:MAG: DHHA1 domain-containing protein, partial [Candidatus Omnitrophica bacterium]|nr:DHHA1 domain-containing protein [Candidatus Omnitrophota bacterium]
LAISVDCSNKEILGRAYGVFEKALSVLEIDHHDARRPFGDLQLIDSSAAAVGEIIYTLLKKLGVAVDEEIAQNILTSIIVETNSFRLPNVKPYTFRLCGALAEIVTDFQKLVDIVYWSKTREGIILSGICMSRCKFVNGGSVAWSIIRRKDYDKVKGKDDDVDEVADLIRSIEKVRIAVLFREQDKKRLRVSLRSKGANVAAIAEMYNGGGHFDIAGCTIPNDRKTIRKLLTQLTDLDTSHSSGL